MCWSLWQIEHQIKLILWPHLINSTWQKNVYKSTHSTAAAAAAEMIRNWNFQPQKKKYRIEIETTTTPETCSISMLIEMLQRKHEALLPLHFISSFLIHEMIIEILLRKQIVSFQAHFDVLLLLFLIWSFNINIEHVFTAHRKSGTCKVSEIQWVIHKEFHRNWWWPQIATNETNFKV